MSQSIKSRPKATLDVRLITLISRELRAGVATNIPAPAPALALAPRTLIHQQVQVAAHQTPVNQMTSCLMAPSIAAELGSALGTDPNDVATDVINLDLKAQKP